jgi:hypothetical protein
MVCKQKVACCCMINVAPVQAFDYELTRESKIFAHFQSLLVNILRRKIFRNTAVIRVTQFRLVILIVKQVVHVDIVNIALYRL